MLYNLKIKIRSKKKESKTSVEKIKNDQSGFNYTRSNALHKVEKIIEFLTIFLFHDWPLFHFNPNVIIIETGAAQKNSSSANKD